MKIPDEAIKIIAAAENGCYCSHCVRLRVEDAAPAIVRANFADELRRWLTQFTDQYGLDDDAVRAALKRLVDDD